MALWFPKGIINHQEAHVAVGYSEDSSIGRASVLLTDGCRFNSCFSHQRKKAKTPPGIMRKRFNPIPTGIWVEGGRKPNSVDRKMHVGASNPVQPARLAVFERSSIMILRMRRHMLKKATVRRYIGATFVGLCGQGSNGRRQPCR